MNNRSRHMQYRKSIYRKKRTRILLITVPICIALLFALFLIVGTLLHNKLAKDADGNQSLPDDPPTYINSPLSSSAVGAYPLALLEDGSTFSERLSALSADAKAVCIGLNDSDGNLLYRSSLTASISDIKTATDATSLSNSISALDRKGMYVSGSFIIDAFEEENKLLQGVKLSIASAVVCDAMSEGVNDVMLTVNNMTEESINALCSMADDIHESFENACIGIVLDESIIVSGERDSLIATLASHFDYLALNTASIKPDEDTLEHINSYINAMNYEIIRYGMRIVLPNSDDADSMNAYISAVKSHGISNWTFIP